MLYALVTAAWVSKQDAGTDRMQQISNAVKEGAYAFLTREYKTVAMVAVILLIIIAVVPALGLMDGLRLPDRDRRLGLCRLCRHVGYGTG